MNFSGIDDFEMAAKKKLLPAAYDYYAGGALEERALAANSQALRGIKLCNRALSGVLRPDAATEVLGIPLSMPVMAASTAFQGMADPQGEVATARAAAEAGSVMNLSSTSNRSIADVCAAAPGRVWFQLYMFKDAGINRELLARAAEAGCKAILLTVDVPAWGRRERDMRNRFRLPEGLKIESLLIEGRSDFYDGTFQTDLGSFINERFKFDLSWEDLEWLRANTALPVILKGVMHPDDAQRGIAAGAAGIVVSNHGGRQLDDAPATIEALGPIVDRIGNDVPIILDGGIRRGADVVKALALGATAVAIGRPILWGLAANGQQGVSDVFELIRAELLNTMSLCGCARVSDISKKILWSEIAGKPPVQP